MAPQVVEVEVPDGVSSGEDFLIEFQGMQLSVACPSGCGSGDAISIEVDVPAAAPQVEVVVPDGCYPGMEFTVEYEGRSFNVAVPEGCEPGMPLSVEVPAGDSGGGSSQTQEEQDAELARQLQAEEDELSQNLQEQRDAELAKSLQGDEVRESAYCGGGSSSTWSSTAGDAPASGWAPASQSQSLFSMAVGTDDGTFGKPAGDFHVGQLVQVTRSDGTWTYGKIMQHDSGGDTYSVMTRAGAKHFVERDCLTDDVVVNPSDGSCAQQ